MHEYGISRLSCRHGTWRHHLFLFWQTWPFEQFYIIFLPIFSTGGKASTWEGGIRVPTIVKYPGVVPPGLEISEPTKLEDLLPTIAGIAGAQLPNDRVYDGKDLMPLLTRGKTSGPHHEFMYHYCGSYLHAARYTPKGKIKKLVYKS